MVMEELGIGPRPSTITPKEDVVEVTVQDMELVLKRLTTLPCSML